jgi:hypothetical protein
VFGVFRAPLSSIDTGVALRCKVAAILVANADVVAFIFYFFCD